jgi:hypothetical protein
VSLVAAAGAGLAAGLVHVLTGPDHLTAVAPLSAARAAPGWRVGAAWGVGHSFGVAVLAAIAIAARGWLRPDWVSVVSERLVGVVLIGLGCWGIGRVLARFTASREHRHGETLHSHPHWRAPRREGPPEGARHSHAPLWIGALHGLAGGTHLLGALAALALPVGPALAFLGGFAAGTIGGMTAFTAAVGRMSLVLPGRFAAQALLGGVSAASIAVGVAWLLA